MKFKPVRCDHYASNYRINVKVSLPYDRFWIKDQEFGDNGVQIRLEANRDIVFLSTNQPGKKLITKSIPVEEFLAKFREAFFNGSENNTNKS